MLQDELSLPIELNTSLVGLLVYKHRLFGWAANLQIIVNIILLAAVAYALEIYAGNV